MIPVMGNFRSNCLQPNKVKSTAFGEGLNTKLATTAESGQKIAELQPKSCTNLEFKHDLCTDMHHESESQETLETGVAPNPKCHDEVCDSVTTIDKHDEIVSDITITESIQASTLEYEAPRLSNRLQKPLKPRDKDGKGVIEETASMQASDLKSFNLCESLLGDNKVQNDQSSLLESVAHQEQHSKPYRVKQDGKWQRSTKDMEYDDRQLELPQTFDPAEMELQQSNLTFGSSWRDRKTQLHSWSHVELPVNTRAEGLRSALYGKPMKAISTSNSSRQWTTHREPTCSDHSDWRSKQDGDVCNYLDESFNSDSSDDDIIQEVMLPAKESKFVSANYERQKQFTEKQQRESKEDTIQMGERKTIKSKLLTLHSLNKLKGMDSKSILTELTKYEPALNECIKKCSTDTSHLETFLTILAKAYVCEKLTHALIMLFETLKENNFFDILVLFLVDLQDRMSEKTDFVKHEQVLKNILQIIVAQVTRNPSSVTAFSRIHTVIGKIIVESVLDKEIQINFKQFSDHKKATEKVLKSYSGKQETIQPPEDFRTIQVSPSSNEIKGAVQPFLRANKIDGEYDDLDHYLDVQFRLLREDFVGPLREGISEYIKSNSNTENARKANTDIKIYNARVRSPIITQHGFCYQMQLEMTPRLRRLNWSVSKRLIYGSLVCLTEDNFSTFTLATVVGRDENDIKLGLFTISLEGSISTDDLLHKSFKIAETTAYFESYRHVLAGLQTIKMGDLPFEKYIVCCKNEISPPAYVTAQTSYDLRPLVDQHAKIYGQRRLPEIGVTRQRQDYHYSFGINTKYQSKLKEYNFSCDSQVAKRVNVLDVTNWPERQMFHLDESQYAAIKMALTKEFSIIQGPPGTGKTYIGLQIARALLHNKHKWESGDLKHSAQPILIVCYTNHALDQFLEGVYNFYEGDILRVGGRSNSSVLENCNLRKYRHCYTGSESTLGKLKQIRREAKDNLEKCSQDVRLWAKSLELYQREIVHEDYLFPEMNRRFYNNLITGCKNRGHKTRDKSYILKWLGITHMIANVKRQNRKQTSEQAFVTVEDEYTSRRGSALFYDDDIELSNSEKDLIKCIRQAAIAFYVEDVFNLETLTKTGFMSEEIRKLRTENEFRRNLRRTLQSTLSSKDIMTQEEANCIVDIWRIGPNDRWRLYRMWVKQLCDGIFNKIESKRADFEAASERYRDALLEEDKEIMRNASVIGMTTSCAAKYQSVLNEIEPKIIIVEEAAEVLEAHIVATLSKGCEHLILIGDHKQLRPNPTVYRLAVRYNMNISLFERMVKNGINFNSLELQHRMRPDIADIIRHIYPGLKDHDIVKTYPNVKGVSTNVHLIHHEHMEGKDEDIKSYSNIHEAVFVTNLCQYLLQQGYERKQVTVLTTYTGQLMCIRNFMPHKGFEGVKVTVVDNYQGEENDIVILSLVRSNPDDTVGFLKIDNRVCVALSRAKVGFYVIGNFHQLAKHSNLWKTIVQNMREKGRCGDGLKLNCQNHPNDDAIIAMEGKDFKRAPNGGCSKRCEARLQCGHVCEMFCHVTDTDHTEYKCRKACHRVICEHHTCPDPCYIACKPCSVIVTKIIPACNHEQRVTCSVDASQFICKMPCEAKLPCQHMCINICGEPHTKKCQVQVELKLPCNHTVTTDCCQTVHEIVCPATCQTLLKCEHLCEGTCGKCFRGRVHMPCKQMCKRILVCGHECTDFCNNCPPCEAKCENRCVHSLCQNKCGELCVQCLEPCEWNCIHFQCNKVCSDPCDRPRCNEPCEKQLPCGHPCMGLCGEPCAAFFCRVCEYGTVTEILFGDEDDPEARFVFLEDCGHNIESKAMDMYMDMKDEEEAVQLKGCPQCKTPIRRCLRYGTIVKENLQHIERVKQMALANKASIEDLYENLNKEADVSTAQDDFYFRSTMEDRCIGYHSKRHYANILASRLIKDRNAKLTENKLIVIKNQHILSKALTEIRCGLKRVDSVNSLGKKDLITFFGRLVDHILDERETVSEQELDDYKREIQRGYTYCRFQKLQVAISRASKMNEASNHTEMIDSILTLREKYTDDMVGDVEEELKQLTELTKIDELNISEEERLEIVKAVRLSKGHWFKCPNNHIYAIGECGGATQRGKCPECKADIGGKSHRLTEGNKLAPEMDGASFAAYSEEANNMANFDLNDLH